MSNIDDIAYEGVEVQLDKKRRIKYTFSGIRIILKKYKSLQKAFKALEGMGGGEGDITEEDIDIISTLIYAGLIHEDETLTQKQVESMIDFRNVFALIGAVTEALSGSMPEDEVDKKNPKNPAL